MSSSPFLSCSEKDLVEWLDQENQPHYRIRQVREWIFRRRATSFEMMSNLPKKLRQDLSNRFTPIGSSLQLAGETTDETRKLLVRLEDGNAVEAVLMQEQGRNTICVSTQVGCAMACSFCASGLDGVKRNLESHEIIEQFLLATTLLPSDEVMTHAVIMGMGEPLANLDNLLIALDQVCAPNGLGIGQRHVTISTVGLPKQIRQLADCQKQFHLAISLHAPNDSMRNELVPPNKAIGLEAILDAADYFRTRTGRQVTVEYVLLRDVNDRADDAMELTQLLKGRRVHVNLIPYNPVSGIEYQTPRSEIVSQFVRIIRHSGITATVRKTKGRRIDAACGQLRLNQKQQPLGS